MNIIFDLDGTLTDPKEGICNSIQFSMKKFNLEPPSHDELAWCIGPPLVESFQILVGHSRAKEAVAHYREYFSVKGLFENKPYPGVSEMLKSLKDNSDELYVATSKPKVYADRILDRFNLSQFFNHIYGSELDGTRSHKSELLKFVIKSSSLNKKESVMVGDRMHDLVGAKANDLKAIAVLYGYGSESELKQHHPLTMCSTVDELKTFIESSRSSFSSVSVD